MKLKNKTTIKFSADQRAQILRDLELRNFFFAYTQHVLSLDGHAVLAQCKKKTWVLYDV